MAAASREVGDGEQRALPTDRKAGRRARMGPHMSHELRVSQRSKSWSLSITSVVLGLAATMVGVSLAKPTKRMQRASHSRSGPIPAEARLCSCARMSRATAVKAGNVNSSAMPSSVGLALIRFNRMQQSIRFCTA